ncbi:MAG: hypothetical protein V1914_03565 [archaeon]
MARYEIISETPVTFVELKDELSKIEKRDKELSFRGNKTKEYLNIATQLKLKDAKELKKKIEDLNVLRLKEKQIVKIINVLPKDTDSLKVVLSSDSVTSKEDLKKILDIVSEY